MTLFQTGQQDEIDQPIPDIDAAWACTPLEFLRSVGHALKSPTTKAKAYLLALEDEGFTLARRRKLLTDIVETLEGISSGTLKYLTEAMEGDALE